MPCLKRQGIRGHLCLNRRRNMINKENVLKLAAFIDAGSVPWDIYPVGQCFFGQYTAMTQGGSGDLMFDFLGVPRDDYNTRTNMVTPEFYYSKPELYPKERAVKMLHNLAETGEVDWDVS
jgi:hypothetical protein